MFRTVLSQTKILLSQKGAKITFYILLIAVLWNYFLNLKEYSNVDKASMPAITEFCVCSGNNLIGGYVISFICFLVVLPGGISFAIDKKLNIDIYLKARCRGKYRYIISKMIAAFISTFICVSIPFLIELLLNACAFPVESSVKMQSISNVFLVRDGGGYNPHAFMYDAYMYHPIMYSFVRIMLLGLFASSLAIISMAFSCVHNKFLAYLMIPVYFLASIFMQTKFKVFGHKISHNYYGYLLWDEGYVTGEMMTWFYVLIESIVIASVIFILVYEWRKEV